MWKTWSKTIVYLAEGNLERGIKWVAFENLSITVRTTVLPLEGGKPVTKSIAVCDQGREGTEKTAPNPTSVASTSTMICRDRSGVFKMGAKLNQLVTLSNAVWACDDQRNHFLVEVRSVRGRAT